MKDRKIISNVCISSALGLDRHAEDGSEIVWEYRRVCASNRHGDVFIHNHVWERRWFGEGRSHDESDRLCQQIEESFLDKKSIDDLDFRYWSRSDSAYGSDAYVERDEERAALQREQEEG